MCPTSSGPTETDNKICQQITFPSTTQLFPRQLLLRSCQEHHLPENFHTPSTFVSTIQPFPRPLLPLQTRHVQQPTSLTFTFNSASMTLLIHGVSYVARTFHVFNVATVPAPTRTITDGIRNHSQ